VSERGLRTVAIAVLVTAALAIAAAGQATAGSAARIPRLGLNGYGDVQLDSPPHKVRTKLGEPLTCFHLGGRCVCARATDGTPDLTFVFGLDRVAGLDVIFTGSRAVFGPRALRVGDSIGRMRRLFPHTHRLRRPGYPGFQRFAFARGSRGLLAEARRGRIVMLVTGKKRFLAYDEFCA
jgi:hypothetical protein